MAVIHRDYETASRVDLAQAGAWRYAADVSTDVLCAAWAIDDGEIEIWLPGQPVPEAIIAAASNSSCLFVAHNDLFETAIETHVLGPRFGWPMVPLQRHRCTAARARAGALPGSLDGAATALGLTITKDKEGQALMRRLARKKPNDTPNPQQLFSHDLPTPQDLERLAAYCRRDVEIERELYRRLPPLTDSEQELWVLDQEINARGFHVDRRLALAMRDVAVKRRAEIADELSKLTESMVTSPNQTERIKTWLTSRGHNLNTLDKKTKAKLASKTLAPDVQRVIELVTEGTLKTVDKADALLAGIDADDRIRGALIYCGATSGRWTASGFQPQNISRENENLDIGKAIAAFRKRDMNAIKALGMPLGVAAGIARGLITAAPGKLLLAADYSQIDARVLAWFATEEHVLEDFRKYDETGDTQYEIYCRAASLVLGRAVTKASKTDRNIGKTATLALGYGGGVPAWRNYDDATPELEVRKHIAAWRKSRPTTVKFWDALDNALRGAIGEPGKVFKLGRLTAWFEDAVLHIQLPSSRVLRFPDADVVDGRFEETWNIRFKKWDQGKWKATDEWFGKFVATVVSATARDLMADAMLRLATAGYEIVLTVHDEIVAEIADDGVDRGREFVALMTQRPAWADGLPVVADGRCGRRYIKCDDEPDLAEEEFAAGPEEPVGDSPSRDFEEILVKASPKEDKPPPGTEEPGRSSGYDQREQQKDAGKPYAPVRQRLINKGYRLAKSFPFTVPGDTAPLFWEDRWVRPNGDGKAAKECRFRHVKDGVELRDTGPRRIIYNWAGVLKAGLTTPIFITEGAAKCDPLIAAGLIATAAPYHTFKGECATALAGRILVYLEDHDPPGRDHSARAQRQLGPAAASFKILPALALWKDLGHAGEPPSGWDVKDWVEAGGDPKRLYEIAEAEPVAAVVDPVDLWGHFDPPKLPTGLLPSLVQEFAFEQADLMGADPAGLAMSALAVCAAALPDHTKLQVKRHDPHWLEAARLWVGVIGDPSTKKSPIISRAAAPLKRLDTELMREYQAANEVYESLSKEEQEHNEPPAMIRLWIGDTTIEAAQEALKDNPHGVLCIQDELSGWFGSMDKYSGRGAGKDRSFWLESYNGGVYRVDRIKRGAVLIENLSIAMLGGIQPAPLRRIAEDSVDDGLLQRIIPVMLAPGRVSKDAPGGKAGRRYDGLVASLRSREPPGKPLYFDDDALKVREALEARHNDLVAECAAFNKRLSAHIGKYDGIFARLCLLWHCIEGANGSAITAHTAQRVADFMDRFMLPHAVAFYADTLQLSDDHERLSQMAGYILAKKLTQVTCRDMQSGVRSMRGLERQDVESILEQLEALGWLFRVEGPRRLSAIWDVNPEVHRKFADRAAREARERSGKRASILETAAEIHTNRVKC